MHLIDVAFIISFHGLLIYILHTFVFIYNLTNLHEVFIYQNNEFMHFSEIMQNTFVSLTCIMAGEITEASTTTSAILTTTYLLTFSLNIDLITVVVLTHHLDNFRSGTDYGYCVKK